MGLREDKKKVHNPQDQLVKSLLLERIIDKKQNLSPHKPNMEGIIDYTCGGIKSSPSITRLKKFLQTIEHFIYTH